MKQLLFATLFAFAIGFASPSFAGDGCTQSPSPGCGGCPCESCVCNMDSFCCYFAWDSLCVGECIDMCGGCSLCGNGNCDPEEAENCDTCPEDCACPGGEVCNGGVCCEPQCAGLECGDDGCGGLCGTCEGGTCFGGTCCFPQCGGKACGDDGCGGSCGECPPFDKCVNGACEICVPDCTDKNCGTDGCGGSCGDCEYGEFCPATGICEGLPRCEPVATLPCETVATDSTVNGSNTFQAYSCAGGLKQGTEVAYAFAAEEDDTVTVKLTKLEGAIDLALYLVGDPCIEDNCLDHDSKKLTFPVEAGNTYNVIVDGGAGAPTSYKLELLCASECETQCVGKTCGDDGCGGTCGSCDEGMLCALGNCSEYGGFGWPCLGNFECNSGFCKQGPQAKVCTKECGSCPAGWSCEEVTVDGDSVSICLSDCLPECTDNECGDNGCGYPCGSCDDGYLCEDDNCVEAPCDPNCIGKECGDDGCGGDCGECDEGYDCKGNFCQEIPCDVDCDGLECGPSNCPGQGCGECDEELICQEGLCIEPPCEPQCDMKECGPDGCEGLCGECIGGFQCEEGLCTALAQPEASADTVTIAPSEVTEGSSDITEEGGTDTSSGGSSSSCNTGDPTANTPLALLLLLLSMVLLRVLGNFRAGTHRSNHS